MMLVVRLALLSALLGVVLWKSDFWAIAGRLRLEMVLAIAIIQPLVFLDLLLAGRRLFLLLGTPAAPFGKSFKAVLLGCGCNAIVPGRISEFVKATYLRDHAAVALSAGLSAIVLERLLDLLMLAILAAAAILLALMEVSGSFFIVVLACVAAVFAMAWPFRRALAGLAGRPGPAGAVAAYLERFAGQLSMRMDARVLGRAAFYSLLIWALTFVHIALMMTMVGSIPIGLAGALVLFVATAIGGSIPALPAGLGTYEAAAVFVLRQYGYEMEEAIAIGLVLHASQIVLSLAAACVIMVTERLGIASLIERTAVVLRSQRHG